MALGTIFSRITGLVRNLMIVAVLGTGILGDTYNVGNTTPNIIYNLLIGGSLTAVFVPQIVRAFRDSDGGVGFISKLATMVAVGLLGITALAMLATPLLVELYAPSFEGRARNLTIAFTLYCLPQVFFYGLYGIWGQITNAKERFGPMMWSPIANNLVVIALLSLFLGTKDSISLDAITDSQVRLLGIGTTLGIAVQALILYPFIKRSGITLRLDFSWRGFGLDKSLKLGGWTFISILISQLGFLATVNLATRAAVNAANSSIPYGVGYTPYANAYLILLLPHSIVSLSVVTALLPQLSSFVIDKRFDQMRERLITAIRLIGIITIPASFFFLAFSNLISKSLFFGIDDQSAAFMGKVLAALSFSVIPLSINLVGIRALNAFENTRYQAYSSGAINLIALIASLVAYFTLPAEKVTIGLGIAFTLSYWCGTPVTFILLRRFIGELHIANYLSFYLRVVMISTLAVGLPYAIHRQLNGLGNFPTLVIVVAITTALYFLFARLFKIDEVNQTFKVLLRR